MSDPRSSVPVIYELPSILERIEPAALFPRAQPLEVELGSGDGSFLVEYAGRHPERNFIAVERLLGRIRKNQRKANRLGLSNVRAVRIESSYFLEFLLPEQSAAALHVYFPDPWPKRKHERHRLINERFPELAARALIRGGRVYLRTDDEPYFKQMRQVFAGRPEFRVIETEPELAGVLTDFERDFLARGVPTLRVAYEKTD